MEEPAPSFNNVPPVQTEEPSGTLHFGRALWIIGISILVVQVYQFSLAASHGLFELHLPRQYHLLSLIGALALYPLMTIAVLMDIGSCRVKASSLFNISFAPLKASWREVLAYFVGCAAVIVVMHLLFGADEIDPEARSFDIQLMSWVVTVVIAPICEEMIFRGYLFTAMIPVFKRERERQVVNGMLFACVHVFLVFFLIGASVPYYIFVLGYLLARLYDKHRSIVPCILLHALNNGFVMVLQRVWPPDWSL